MPNDQTVTVENVPIFASGIWNGVRIKDTDLDSMVTSYEQLKDVLHPPLKLGHSEDQGIVKESGFPSIGWVSELKRVGSQILGTFTDVPQVLADLIKKRAYRFVSPEVLPLYKYNEKQYPWTLWGVAILGNEVPAIKTLGDISAIFNGQAHVAKMEAVLDKISDKFSSMVLKFSDTNGTLVMEQRNFASTICDGIDRIKKFRDERAWESRERMQEHAKTLVPKTFESLQEILDDMGVDDISELNQEEFQELQNRLRGDYCSQKENFGGQGSGRHKEGGSDKPDDKKVTPEKPVKAISTIGLNDAKDLLKELWLALHPTHRLFSANKFDVDGGASGSGSSAPSGNSVLSEGSSPSGQSEYHQPGAMNKIAVGEKFNRKKKIQMAGVLKSMGAHMFNVNAIEDEDIWKKAKESVDPEGKGSHYDNPYAVVTDVYKKMGGRMKSGKK